MQVLNKRHYLLLIFVLFSTVTAQDNRQLNANVLVAMNNNPELVNLGRYMENSSCEATSFPNWEGFELRKCKYRQEVKSINGRVREKNSLAGGNRTFVNAEVIMLNPKKDVLFKWILATCMITHPTANEDQLKSCATKFAKDIKSASGSQFAIAGIVLEDLNWYPVGYGIQQGINSIGQSDGMAEVYMFQDGVTVKLTGSKLNKNIQQVFDQSDIDFSLNPNSQVELNKETTKARIASTTRKEYRNLLGQAAKDVSGNNWLKIVRELYQDAWKRAHNNALPETVEKYRNILLLAKRPTINF